MRKIVAIILIIALQCGNISVYSAVNMREIYVSTNGSKNSQGTINDPLDTLNSAISYLENSNDKTPATIYMRGGTYNISSPIVITNKTTKFPITIKSYEMEKPIISGGRKLGGFELDDEGLASVYVSDYDQINTLLVNGIAAQRSRLDTQIYINKREKFSVFDTGFVVKKGDLPPNITGVDAEVVILLNWMDFHLKVDSIKSYSSTEYLIDFKRPITNYMLYGGGGVQFTDNMPITLENDKALLDKAGEFYFDRHSKMLYYKLRDGENINSLNAFIGKEEVLLKIQGENSENKASNVTFDGITFANVGWNKPATEGYVCSQGARYVDNTNDIESARLHNLTVPSAVQVTMADNISFTRCIFTNIEKSGLGLYEGVNNSKIEGNIFSDISHTAMTVGLPSHSENAVTGVTDVAYKKPCFADSYYMQYVATNVTDGDKLTFLSNNSPSLGWCVVDLEGLYTIDSIKIQGRCDDYDYMGARSDFVLEGADNRNFTNSTVFHTQGHSEAFAYKGSKEFKVNVPNKFRYIRFRKIANSSGLEDFIGQNVVEIANMNVYTKDLGGIAEKEVCKNNVISNNYITRCGGLYKGGVGIHAFYTESLIIENNEFCQMPYTAISLGWGWSSFVNSNTAKNNKVRNNKFTNISMEMADGGAIYTLGNQPNLEITGNYIKNARYGPGGGIYPDEGSSGLTSATAINVSNNVIEDVSVWLMVWTKSIQFINVYSNYVTCPFYRKEGTYINVNTTDNPNKLYVRGNPPPQVAAIIDGAGIISKYEDIKNNVRISPKPEAETVEFYKNYGNSNNKGHTLASTEHYKIYFILNLMMEGNWYDYLVRTNGIDVSKSPQYATFKGILDNANAVYNDVNSTYDTVITTRVALVNSMQQMLDTGILNTIINNQTTINDALIKNLIGNYK